ncbi:MAG: hypothetical protein R3Y28_06525, partial [Candidatus Gastranaerophilales bacterium]
NMQSEALERKQELFDGRIEEAMNQMRFHEKLTGYTSAMDFVEELGNYIKINEVCDNDELTECFPDTVHTYNGYKMTDVDLNSGADIGTALLKASLFSNNLGIIFADGVVALLNYSEDCEWLDPYDGGASRADASNCLSMIYDLNGKKGKNTAGSDIYTLNAVIDCIYLSESGTCFNQTAFVAPTISYSDCESMREDYGVNYCYTGSNPEDNWFSAVVACGGIDKVATPEDLAELASLVYNTTVNADKSRVSLVGELNDIYIDILGISVGASVWANSVYENSGYAVTRTFAEDYTQDNYSANSQINRGSRSLYTLCVE